MKVRHERVDGKERVPRMSGMPRIDEEIGRARSGRDAAATQSRGVFEREWLLERLAQYGWNISRTADAVGLARESLSRKLKSLKIDVDAERARHAP